MTVLSVLNHLGVLLASGLGVWLMTELAKRAKNIPISQGQTMLIRGVAGAFSGVAVVLVHFSQGDLDGTHISTMIQAFLEIATVWYTSHLAHKTGQALKQEK